MARRKRTQADPVSKGVPPEVAASSMTPSLEELLAHLDTFKRISETQPTTVLKGNRRPPGVTLSSPAYGRTNTGARALCKDASDAHKLPSPQFGGFRVEFSDPLQAIICVPVEKYDENDPDMLRVTWSPDGSEMRCDFASILVPKQWGVPRKMTRWAPVGFYGNLPGYGAVVLISMRHSQLEPITSRKDGRKGGVKQHQQPQAHPAQAQQPQAQQAQGQQPKTQESQTQQSPAQEPPKPAV